MFCILSKSRKASSLLPHSLAPSHLPNLLFPLPSLFPQEALFTTNPSKQKKNIPLPPRPKPPPEHEFEESYVKGTGPGGQKINKTNSAVQLRHLPTGIVVKCQETRSRSENRKIARRILASKLDDMMHGEESRGAKVGEVRRKKKSSAAKKKRRKYRKLAEGKEGEQDEDEEGEEGQGEEDENATGDEWTEAIETPIECGDKEKRGM